MNIKYFRSIVASVCVGSLAPWSALAQPVIFTQPTNQFVNASSSAVFRIGVTGTAPTYQWLYDGAALAGATNYFLSVPNAKLAQSGYYSVIVSNASGSVTSQVAELKVFVAARHSLSGLQAKPDGSVNLSFTGETSALFAQYYDLYPLEASSNLADWTPLATLQRSNAALDSLRFIDADAPKFGQRFYRTPTNQLATPDPQPTGPYPVGTFSMLLTNIDRNNAKFMVTFWYPAVEQAGVLPAKYADPQVATGEIVYNLTSYGGRNFSSQVAAFFQHSLSNASCATNLPACPVVLYDSGGGGHRRENTDKTEELASWGFVVAGLDTSDTQVSVFPDGTVVHGQVIGNTIDAFNAAIEGRLQDMQFVLDELPSLNAGDPRLGGRLDLDKIGVFGWSLGGAAAAQLCLRDSRCKADVGMDGEFYETNLLTQPMSTPYLYLRSGDGPDPDSRVAPSFPEDRLDVYNHFVTNAYWIKLASVVHGNYGDPGLILDSSSLQVGWGLPTSGQFLPGARVSQIVRAYLLSFFNKFLQGKNDHLLDGPSPAYPEVIQFLTKSGLPVPPEYPSTALAQGSDGNLYGTTRYGGEDNLGSVFRLTPTGVLTILVSFNGTNGGYPFAGLVEGGDGNFYGTTSYGGTSGGGTVFQVTPAGALTTLVSFDATNGRLPLSALVQGSDGDFYGTTSEGGSRNYGTVFKTSASGVLTTLASLSGSTCYPYAGLVQGTNGNFYGTTTAGGVSGYGTLFKMTPAGLMTTLVSFSGANGENPDAALVQGNDGNFYGTTAFGGNQSFHAGYGQYGIGTVFRMTPAGVLSTLVSFSGTNGSFPCAGLVQGSDGNFYGTTAGGGANGAGTVFKMTPAGALTTLVSFNGANGNNPRASLVQGTDGDFYGTTEFGGSNGRGTVFRVTSAGVLTTLLSF